MQGLKMPDVNSVLIAGNLISDPTFRKTTTGTPVTNFYIASNRKFRDHTGQWRENVCFVGVVAWYKLAESCYANLQKGSAVLIDGELQSRALRNEDGTTRNIVEIKARRIQFLDRRPAREATPENVGAEAEPRQSDQPVATDIEGVEKPSEADIPTDTLRLPDTAAETTEEPDSAERPSDETGGSAGEENEAEESPFQFGYRDWRP